MYDLNFRTSVIGNSYRCSTYILVANKGLQPTKFTNPPMVWNQKHYYSHIPLLNITFSYIISFISPSLSSFIRCDSIYSNRLWIWAKTVVSFMLWSQWLIFPIKVVCATCLPDPNFLFVALQICFCWAGLQLQVLQKWNQSWILCKFLSVYTATLNFCSCWTVSVGDFSNLTVVREMSFVTHSVV